MENGRGNKGLLRKNIGFIICAAIGVALLLFGGRLIDQPQDMGKDAAQGAAVEDVLLTYTAQLEQKIAALCAEVHGVSQVHVIVSLEGDFLYTYATDSDRREGNGEAQTSDQYVTVGSGSSEQPVLLTRTPPRICGIGIVCRGGGDAAIRQELLSLLSAAYGIGSNNIYIAEANR